MPEININELLNRLEESASAVAEAENAYTERIDTVARRVIDNDKIRVLLLAGPSGSGKTTTANLICDRIKALGEKSMVVSLDNFYRDSTDPDYPKLPSGGNDCESPYALNVPLMQKTLGDIIAGRDFSVPDYDFREGRSVGTDDYPSFADGCVIIEGLHALNPLLSDPFPKENLLKLFVSVSTNINEDGMRLVSGKRLRFARRLVRDNIYRGASALRTMDMWPSVIRGEEEYLYPYKESADIKFDTFHLFEPAVMKPYVLKLLTDEVIASKPYFATVRAFAERMPDFPEEQVPDTSLIREFIPGGIYENLYY